MGLDFIRRQTALGGRKHLLAGVTESTHLETGYTVPGRSRKEMAIFMNRSGVVGLDCWCNGPDAERFPELVGAIERKTREQSAHTK